MGSVKKATKEKGPQKRTLSPADEADAKALEHAVQTMIEGPLTSWDHTRPLGSLNRDDLRKLATACLTGWILQRAANGCHSDSTMSDLISAAGSAE
ncbi:MAG: hypothetical protein CMJ32_00085 [Phycisphaerae bacterium]|nr:hypothetical protein [Phycisphaerae bacterium]